MNHHQKIPSQRTKNPAYRRAFERLDAALEENTPSDKAEYIRRMREFFLVDVEEFEKSGGIKIPE
jgi:hypothetical protein